MDINLLTSELYKRYKDNGSLPTDYKYTTYNKEKIKVEEKKKSVDKNDKTKELYNDTILLRKYLEIKVNLIKDLMSLVDPSDDEIWLITCDDIIQKTPINLIDLYGHKITLPSLGFALYRYFNTYSPWHESIVKRMGEWYLSSAGFSGNYSLTTTKYNYLISAVSRADCSGFVSSCLAFAGINTTRAMYNSLAYSNASSGIGQQLIKYGFEIVTVNNDNELQGGDIVFHPQSEGNVNHVYIVAWLDTSLSFDYGNDRGHLPVHNGIHVNSNHVVWRCKGLFMKNIANNGMGLNMPYIGQGSGYDTLNSIITELHYDKYREFLNKTAYIESRGKSNALIKGGRDGHNSACGWFGITSGTRLQYTNVSREDFLNNPKLQVLVCVKHYNHLLNEAKSQGAYLGAKLKGFSDDEIVKGYWSRPSSAKKYFKDNILEEYDNGFGKKQTILDVIKHYRSVSS